MELQIQDLVTSIRKEGVDVANEKAEGIISDAQSKATDIVAKAKKEAKEIRESSQREIEILKESAVVSAEQAKRDAMLAFKEEVNAELDKILAVKVQEAMQGSALATLIKSAVAGEDISKYAAEVSEVSTELKGALADEIKSGLELKASRTVSGGFKLAAKDGSGYIDCSDEELLEQLKPYFRNLEI